VWTAETAGTFRFAVPLAGDLSDETDAELERLLPRLVGAGYVRIDGESPTGYHWRFTPQGVQRAETLGLD
jgi:hypothetical protein